MRKLTFFGDSELRPSHPVMVFDHGEYGACVCDWTECGMYIASKHLRNGDKLVEVTVEELFKMFPLDIEVEAWNNGIAWFFRRNNIKTLKDLYAYFESNR
jgi:hypothetical protein